MAIAEEQIRQNIADNNLSSVADVYSLLKDSFKGILQELMEAEPDASLGYEKNQKGNVRTSNKRNGHPSKTLKSRYGEFQIYVPRDREGGRILSRAAYIVPGITAEGYKDILSITAGSN